MKKITYCLIIVYCCNATNHIFAPREYSLDAFILAAPQVREVAYQQSLYNLQKITEQENMVKTRLQKNLKTVAFEKNTLQKELDSLKQQRSQLKQFSLNFQKNLSLMAYTISPNQNHIPPNKKHSWFRLRIINPVKNFFSRFSW